MKNVSSRLVAKTDPKFNHRKIGLCTEENFVYVVGVRAAMLVAGIFVKKKSGL